MSATKKNGRKKELIEERRRIKERNNEWKVERKKERMDEWFHESKKRSNESKIILEAMFRK